VVAAPRSTPIREYLLFELQPLIRLKKTIILTKTKYQMILILWVLVEKKNGMNCHTDKAINRTRLGVKLYKNLFLNIGVYLCLVNNFSASKRGCRSPRNLTLLGPFRIWKQAISFRSNKVKKAIIRRMST